MTIKSNSGWLALGAVDVEPQRWARIASWAAFGCTVPSVVWRLAMLAGADTGFADAAAFRADGALRVYVLALDVVEVTAGLLCLGLAQRWGERVPRWVPRLGGRVIPRLLPTVLGGAGAGTLFVVMGGLLIRFGGSWLGVTDAWTPADGMSPAQATVLVLAYGPFVAWPVALTVALVGYWRRRTPPEVIPTRPGVGAPDEIVAR